MEQYINKDAILTEIETMKSAAEVMLTGKTDLSYWKAQKLVCEKLLSYIDTLETKKVDLEKEFDSYCENLYAIDIQEEPFTEMYDCAKHFYGLGLNAQKGK